MKCPQFATPRVGVWIVQLLAKIKTKYQLEIFKNVTSGGRETYDWTIEESFESEIWSPAGKESFLSVRKFILQFKCCVQKELENKWTSFLLFYIFFIPCSNFANLSSKILERFSCTPVQYTLIILTATYVSIFFQITKASQIVPRQVDMCLWTAKEKEMCDQHHILFVRTGDTDSGKTFSLIIFVTNIWMKAYTLKMFYLCPYYRYLNFNVEQW